MAKVLCPYDYLDIHANCFGRNTAVGISKYCLILNDTNFKGECPFYKTYEAYRSGLRKYGGTIPTTTKKN